MTYTHTLCTFHDRLSAKHRDSGAWFHPNFLRGSPNQLTKLARIKIKGGCNLNKIKEPGDFYRMPPLPEEDMDHPLTKFLQEIISSQKASSDSKVVSRATEVQSKPSSFPSVVESTPTFGLHGATSNQQANVPPNLSYNDNLLGYPESRMAHQPMYLQPSDFYLRRRVTDDVGLPFTFAPQGYSMNSVSSQSIIDQTRASNLQPSDFYLRRRVTDDIGHPFNFAPQGYSMNSLSSQSIIDQTRASSDYFQSSSIALSQSVSQEYTKFNATPSTVPSYCAETNERSPDSEVSDDELFEPLPYDSDSFASSSDDFSDYIAETIRKL